MWWSACIHAIIWKNEVETTFNKRIIACVDSPKFNDALRTLYPRSETNTAFPPLSQHKIDVTFDGGQYCASAAFKCSRNPQPNNYKYESLTPTINSSHACCVQSPTYKHKPTICNYSFHIHCVQSDTCKHQQPGSNCSGIKTQSWNKQSSQIY